VTSGNIECRSVCVDVNCLQTLSTPQHGSANGITWVQELILVTRSDVQEAFPLPTGSQAFKQWFNTHGLEEHDYGDFLAYEGQANLQAQPYRHVILFCV